MEKWQKRMQMLKRFKKARLKKKLIKRCLLCGQIISEER